ncbi:hypothetical protein N665_0093s0053 [Sinapis alba]|nr:hypothetical protein N665_0093s0053 [Sinapis alba]
MVVLYSENFFPTKTSLGLCSLTINTTLTFSHQGVPQHQVFISFQGQDIRHGFIAYLQAGLKESGINFFIDVENLTGRGNIDHLFMEVGESRIALVVFTEKYLSSAWCLEELVEINKCMKMNSLKAIPIFFNVNPRDVIREDQLVENWGITDARINRWKEALNSVGMLQGLVSEHQK